MWNRIYGSALVAAHLPGQRRVPYWPRERIEALRDRRIREIVGYAARTVPYYRDLFARERIDPRDVRGAADLDHLPLVDRNLVRTRPELFRAESAASREALAFLTSGSSGTPIQIHHDRRSLLLNLAFGERERDPVIRGAGGNFRPKELYVGYETSTFKKVIAFCEASTLMPVRPRRRFVSLLEPVEEVAAIANHERPDVLVGYGGWIDLFFKTVNARGIALHPPRMVMYMGEALPHGARELIEGRFGIPVLSRYNAVESFKIGFLCEQRSGFHVHEDLCHVRIAAADGAPVPAGTAGEVVISNLINRGSVLLNYPIGDLASMTPERCGCGRTFRLLSELEGRVEDVLPLDGGRFVHPRAVWEVLKIASGVLQYRLIQHDPERFTLELVTIDEAAYRAALDAARPALARLLGEGARIEASRKDAIERAPGGKLRAVESKCRAARVAGSPSASSHT